MHYIAVACYSMTAPCFYSNLDARHRWACPNVGGYIPTTVDGRNPTAVDRWFTSAFIGPHVSIILLLHKVVPSCKWVSPLTMDISPLISPINHREIGVLGANLKLFRMGAPWGHIERRVTEAPSALGCWATGARWNRSDPASFAASQENERGTLWIGCLHHNFRVISAILIICLSLNHIS